MKLTLAILILAGSISWAKRAPPPKIRPLVKDSVEYYYVIEPLLTGCPKKVKSCGQRVFMTATNKKANALLWKTELYQNKFNPNLETDVQMIFPQSMAFISRGRVELIDETTRHFFIKQSSGKMEWPALVRQYRGQK